MGSKKQEPCFRWVSFPPFIGVNLLKSTSGLVKHGKVITNHKTFQWICSRSIRGFFLFRSIRAIIKVFTLEVSWHVLPLKLLVSFRYDWKKSLPPGPSRSHHQPSDMVTISLKPKYMPHPWLSSWNPWSHTTPSKFDSYVPHSIRSPVPIGKVLLGQAEIWPNAALKSVRSAHKSIRSALKAVRSALKSGRSVLKSMSSALKSVSSALKSVSSTLMYVRPALKSVRSSLKSVIFALKSVRLALKAVRLALRSVTFGRTQYLSTTDKNRWGLRRVPLR